MGRYEEQWRRYRRLRRLSLLVLLPFCGVPFFPHGDGSLSLPVLFPIMMLSGFVGVGAWFLLNYFRCPRCGRLFAITWWYSVSIFARKCVHCGLRKFSDGDSLQNGL
jgi:hypothetical protein